MTTLVTPRDLDFSSDFSATTVTVKALTEAGKSFLAEMFGTGAISIELPKSKSYDFAVYAERKGLVV